MTRWRALKSWPRQLTRVCLRYKQPNKDSSISDSMQLRQKYNIYIYIIYFQRKTGTFQFQHNGESFLPYCTFVCVFDCFGPISNNFLASNYQMLWWWGILHASWPCKTSTTKPMHACKASLRSDITWLDKQCCSLKPFRNGESQLEASVELLKSLKLWQGYVATSAGLYGVGNVKIAEHGAVDTHDWTTQTARSDGTWNEGSALRFYGKCDWEVPWEDRKIEKKEWVLDELTDQFVKKNQRLTFHLYQFFSVSVILFAFQNCAVWLELANSSQGFAALYFYRFYVP